MSPTLPEISTIEALSKPIKPSLKNVSDPYYGKLGNKLPEKLKNLFKPHIESFNWFLTTGLKLIPQSLSPVEIKSRDKLLTVRITEVYVEKPAIAGFRSTVESKLYPTECRQRSMSYLAKFYAKFSVLINGEEQGVITRHLGSIPMMVSSIGCNLYGMNSKQLVDHGEDENETGGFFIVNGKEKVIRMIEVPRRNFPITLVRPHFKKRGAYFTEYGVFVRSVAKTGLSKQLWLHYLNNGMFCLCVMLGKGTYILPLMLVVKAFANLLDVEIYKEMICTKENDNYFKTCIQNMLRQLLPYNFTSSKSIFAYIGKMFGHRLSVPAWYSDEKKGEVFLNSTVLIHLDSFEEKFRMLSLMTRKVYDFALGKCFSDGLDSVQIAEILVPGHLYQVFMIEKLDVWNINFARGLQKKMDLDAALTLNIPFVRNCMGLASDITKPFVTMMATGNMPSRDRIGIPQDKGLVIVAEKINFIRYISHFRAVHKGAKFKEMRDTKCRRLTADCWGFLCPVHTPDGTPCGLLNHLAHLCEIVTHPPNKKPLLAYLHDHGMIPPGASEVSGNKDYYFVLLDGAFIGWLSAKRAKKVAQSLRYEKALKFSKIPETVEICLIEYSNKPTQYPGFYLFTESARMMRPVLQISSGNIEMVGTFEQMYMDICIVPEEAHEFTTHQELNQHTMLSAVASLTPFSDHNQSPRNMYQCQMAKQTMGTSSHTVQLRGDNKAYRLMTPQTPIVRPYMYDQYGLDDYCLGTNAVVAVISYTGYDMEDAMILNKSSLERGFCWGSIYKTEIIDLAQEALKTPGHLTFGYVSGDIPDSDYKLNSDGLPFVGQYLEQNSQYYSFINHASMKMTIKKYQSSESAYVESVKLLGDDSGTSDLNRVSITLRVPRNPMIGDKFASRHGQKGVCSRLWPTESIPFTESGMFPDIIFNPHGFPSRMTIGMMIESMAGKAAAANGQCYDATPFTFTEDNPAIAYFGEILTKAGFNYYGTEKMYSGVSGLELEAEIFFGVVYYQRLRHMVSDKFQVRTTGAIDSVTHQPLKGRKRGGGMRFGEMERDALLAHGTAMLLHDRLLTNSDLTQTYVCEKCHSILSPLAVYRKDSRKQFWHCKMCNSSEHLVFIDLPFVYQYLVNELAAMNIKTTINLQ